MAAFVAQSLYPSTNRRTRSRAAYWDSDRLTILRAARDYLEADPRGPVEVMKTPPPEEVTVAVIDRLGIPRIKEVARARGTSFDTAKQDLGSYIVQVLVERYGGDRVFTLRGPDGRSPSTRSVSPSRWPHLAELAKYTPHQVLPAHERPLRIILDTMIVRDFVEGRPHAIDVEELARLRGRYEFSISDGAVSELVYWFQNGTGEKAAFPRWTRRARWLDKILDSTMPVAPGGHERSAFAGLSAFAPTYSVEAYRAYSRGLWAALRDARRLSDLDGAGPFQAPDGSRFTLNLGTPSAPLRSAGQRWAAVIQRLADLLRPAPGQSLPDESHFFAAMHASVVAGMDVDSAKSGSLDLAVRALARRAREAAAKATQPDPTKSHHALDWDLLFYIPLPAVVCTADRRFINFLRGLGTPDAKYVMSPIELVQWLRTGNWPGTGILADSPTPGDEPVTG